MAEKELQEKMLTYRLLEARLDGFLKQRDLVLNKLGEMQLTLSTIEEASEKDSEILIPIGSEAYAYGKLTNQKTFIVEIGAGVALEKNLEDAKTILNKRLNELSSAVTDLQSEIQKVSLTMQRLAPEIESMVNQSKAE